MGQMEDLHLFTVIVENHSISKAADRLNIAKSAVSRRLHLLEDRYSAKLIDRAPGRWNVTETGRCFCLSRFIGNHKSNFFSKLADFVRNFRTCRAKYYPIRFCINGNINWHVVPNLPCSYIKNKLLKNGQGDLKRRTKWGKWKICICSR